MAKEFITPWKIRDLNNDVWIGFQVLDESSRSGQFPTLEIEGHLHLCKQGCFIKIQQQEILVFIGAWDSHANFPKPTPATTGSAG